MNQAEKLALARRELASRELSRRRLLHFTQNTLENYEPGWVHHDICARLERFSKAVAERKSPRLMLLVPPRHGKSELASIRLPAWHLGHHPHHEIINVGYNLDLPMIFSKKVRALLRDPYYQQLFPGTQMDPDTQATEAWMTTKGGGFKAAGVGGGITGKGAHILIIDDPLKNMEEADSADRRELLDNWYQSTAFTRLAPGGGVLFIETWWNYDDLAGRLQQRAKIDPNADQFEVVLYPALSTAFEYRNEDTFEIIRTDVAMDPLPDNVVRLRNIDTALHEERYSTETLKKMRANMFPRIWSALYQQSPSPDEGMYFKKETFRVIPKWGHNPNAFYYTAWDFAIATKQQNDFTVGATVSNTPDDNLYVEDISRFKGDTYEIVETMLNVAERYMAQSNGKYVMGAEDGQIWKSIEPVLRKRMDERKIYPSIQTMKPLTDKMARARPLQGRMQQGKILFCDDASWNQEVFREMLRFPGGQHDDAVDALAWVVRLSMQNPTPRVEEVKRKTKSWKDKLPGAGGKFGASHMSA